MNARGSISRVFCSPATKPWWPWILLSPFLIVLFEYLAVAPIGSRIFLSFELPFLFGLFAAALAILVLPLLLLFRKWHTVVLPWIPACLCYLAIVPAGLWFGMQIRNGAFHSLAERSAPLVAAIKRYENDHGMPPPSLSALVPDYLTEIPDTGIMAYPAYTYETGTRAESHEGNPWLLRVSTPSGGINFDQFLYFPMQNYPQRGYGGSFQRIRDWAYLHE